MSSKNRIHTSPLKQILLLPIALVLTSSCSTYDDEMYKSVPVVSAYLQPGKSIDNFNVSEPISLSDRTSNMKGIDNLEITISNEDTSFVLHSIGEGEYVSDHIVQSNKVYNMRFIYNNKEVSSSTSTDLVISGFSSHPANLFIVKNDMISIRDMEVELTWDNPDSKYCYVHTYNRTSNPEAINDRITDEPEAYSTPPVQDNNTILRGMGFTHFGKYSVTLYMITDEYAYLYETLNNNSKDLNEPETNIVNGRGIFAAYQASTLTIEVFKTAY